MCPFGALGEETRLSHLGSPTEKTLVEPRSEMAIPLLASPSDVDPWPHVCCGNSTPLRMGLGRPRQALQWGWDLPATAMPEPQWSADPEVDPAPGPAARLLRDMVAPGSQSGSLVSPPPSRVYSLGRAGRCRGNMKAGPWGVFGPFSLLAPFSLPPPSSSPCILCPQLLAWGLSDSARGPALSAVKRSVRMEGGGLHQAAQCTERRPRWDLENLHP